jgi:hypothetical protein
MLSPIRALNGIALTQAKPKSLEPACLLGRIGAQLRTQGRAVTAGSRSLQKHYLIRIRIPPGIRLRSTARTGISIGVVKPTFL